MSRSHSFRVALLGMTLFAGFGIGAQVQASQPVNDRPNPYTTVDNHFKMPEGRTWGSTSAVDIDIPDPQATPSGTSAAEGVAVDAAGNVYGAEVGPRALKKYVKQ